ncbi:MAG: aminotransferase class I/II-fold pyridoxal phosphate-dependent enzyme [Cyanobacteriota bacterium]
MQKTTFSTPLLDQLISYCERPMTPFHMPGHAGGNNIHPKIKAFLGDNVFKADLTELDFLDNLSNPTGVIKETQDKIAKIFNAKASFILVNGSTCGLMALILSIVSNGEQILVPRNCHRSIINALILSDAKPVWYLPEWIKEKELFGYISPEKFDRLLEENSNVKAVLIVNPTYEGISSNTGALVSISKKYDIPVIVDEAHGGHWQFNSNFPESALEAGADAVVQSFHKSCGSLSQSSLLHISHKSSISPHVVEENLKLLQSTSPSYILMASLDAATSYIASEEGMEDLNRTYTLSVELRNKLKSIKSISLLESSKNFSIDPTRIFASIKGLSGEAMANIIENQYNIAIESLNNTGNLFFINMGNRQEHIDLLYKTFCEITTHSYNQIIPVLPEPRLPDLKMSLRKAYFSESEKIKIKNASGRICRFPQVKCPPGICMLLPGEEISDYHLNFFNADDEIDVIK